MKLKEIGGKLEDLFGARRKKKVKAKHLEQIDGLISMLETKKAKVKERLDDLEAVNDIPRLKRKLSLAKIHLERAKEHRQKLSS